MGHLRPSTLEDVQELAPRLREADKNEIRAALGLDPLPGLVISYSLSPICQTMVHQNKPIGIWGISPVDDIQASIWMMATDDLKSIQIEFLRKSRQVVEDYNTRFPLLFNSVDERNELHLKWLEWLGFIFISRSYKGPENLPFIDFVRTTNRVYRVHCLHRY